MPDNTAGNIVNAATVKAAGAPVPAPVDPKAAAAPVVDPNAGKEKYVVDGKDYYLTPEQAKAYAQKGISFEPKVSELSRLQQETNQFLKTLKDDPAKILLNPQFGSTPEAVLQKLLSSTKVSPGIKEALGQWYYENVVVQEQMSPEQREAAEYKRQAEEYKTYKEQQETERLGQENQQRINQALQVLKGQISEAMKDAGVPLDHKIAPQLAQRVAQVMRSAHTAGKPVTPKEAMAKVKAEIKAYQSAYYDMLDEDSLVEQIGKENAEKVRKYFLKVAKGNSAPAPKTSAPAAKRDERKVTTPDEFHDYLQELKKKK